MPRPTRIKYPNAFYHVMNRGRGRQDIFHNPQYFSSFLNCLLEANQKFGAIIHAYCLMTNHYHLILETPNANLSSVMRYINGVYTQRYNRLKKTDGSLFRGRFKAILIDEDNYLLNLNRYIHRNPIRIVKNLEDYKWSSYPFYLDLLPTPRWLNKTKTLEILTDGNNDLERYKSYVEKSDKDDFIEDFYSKKYTAAVMGSKDFKKQICNKIISLNHVNKDRSIKNLNDHVTADQIINSVAKVFKVKINAITDRHIGRATTNFPRKLAMYLCQIYAKNSLYEIQKNFNLKSPGSVGKAIFLARKRIDNCEYQKELGMIKEELWLMETG